MSYLERWWRDASDQKKESFAKLVKNGQLEIVGGGWVMNDEVINVYTKYLNFTSSAHVLQHMNETPF
jgi:Ulp1 family protease